MVLAARILLGGLLGGRGIAVLYSAAGGARALRACCF